MYSFQSHYENALSQHYTRVYGGRLQNYEKANSILDRFGLLPKDKEPALAIDMGAGPGFYSVPLARRGYQVVAIDLDANLLSELESNLGSEKVQTKCGDLLDAANYPEEKAHLAICMTDTIAHLDTVEQQKSLFQIAFQSLRNGGTFLCSFRDQSRTLSDTERFLPFYSDDSLIATTFVEHSDTTVRVTDIFYSWDGSSWTMNASAYNKIRVYSDELRGILEESGFLVQSEFLDRGMTYFLCTRNS